MTPSFDTLKDNGRTKTAVCFHGLAGAKMKFGMTGCSQKILKIGHQFYNKHIILPNNADVFVHTWSTNLESDIRQLYKPVEMVCEPGLNLLNSHYNVTQDAPDKQKDHIIFNAILSRFYSANEVIKLKKQHEEKQGFKYDCVMLTRFDITFNKPMVFNKYDMNNMNIACRCIMHDRYKKLIRLHYETSPHVWRHESMNNTNINEPWVNDLFFLSSSQQIDQFVGLYDNFDALVDRGCFDHNKKRNVHKLIGCWLNDLGLLSKVQDTLHFGLPPYEDISLIRRKYFNQPKGVPRFLT